MKKVGFVFAVFAVFMLMGCVATMIPVGGWYTGIRVPVTATSNNVASTKTGEARCISVLSLVAVGDCSIDAAKKNGGIKKVTHVDWDAMNVLGVYGSYKVIVKGQ